MCSGYLMTEQQFKALQEQHQRSGDAGTWGSYQVDAPREKWHFLDMEPILEKTDEAGTAGRDLRKQLVVGGLLVFKIWKLDPRLKKVALAAAIAAAVLLAVLVYIYRSEPLLPPVTVGGFVIALILALVAIFVPAFKWFRPEKATSGMPKNCSLPYLVSF